MPAGPSERSHLHPWLVLALSLLATLAAAPPTWAWGHLGHRLTARVAERSLNPQAWAAVRAMLEEGETLADASTWADENKSRIRGSAPWHYVNVPIDEDCYDERFADRRHGSIVPKLMDFVNVLGDPGPAGRGT